MLNRKDAEELLKKYNSGTCTEEERALVESWYLSWKSNEKHIRREELDSARLQSWLEIEKSLSKGHSKRGWIPYMAAAIIIAASTAGLIIYQKTNLHKQTAEKRISHIQNDILPGGNKAILTLADGTVVSLDDTENGEISEMAGIRISKTKDGQLIYQALDLSGSGPDEDLSLKFNQISTPRGGQYQVLLPDGTKVWLNAASSLKYPVRFSAKERKVELAGEAYFEVAKQFSRNGRRVPFIVETTSQKVEVLGTHFNINSYEDENETLTTLIEGSVRVYPSKNPDEKAASVILKPNQQAVLKTDKFDVARADAENVLAWKNGYFSFNYADIRMVMRQLSRWYDIDVVYNGKIPSETFTGKVQKNMTLAQVLEILAYADVNFKIEGRKMFIFP